MFLWLMWIKATLLHPARLSGSEPSVPLECLHEHAIRAVEVVEYPFWYSCV